MNDKPTVTGGRPMTVTARLVHHPIDRTETLDTRFPVLIDTTARAIGLDRGHGYRAHVLGRGPILLTADPQEPDPMRDLPKKYVHQAALDAQAAGLRAIYAERRRREARRKHLNALLGWVILALCFAGGLAWIATRVDPAPPATLPTPEDWYGHD